MRLHLIISISLLTLFFCLQVSQAQTPKRRFGTAAAIQNDSNDPTKPGVVPGEKSNDEYAKDATTEINVKNADIAAVVKIFSKKTKRNYILDDRVKGKVSIYLPGKVSAEESLRILESVLSFKGFSSVPIGENLWKIVPAREARQTTIPTVIGESEEPPTAAMVTRLLPLKFISAEEMKQLLAQLISTDGLINSYSGTNSLIIIDSEDNIKRIEGIAAELDVPFSDRDMTIIPIEHAEALELAEKLNQILGDPEKESSSDPSRARLGNGDAAIPSISRPAGSTSGGIAQPVAMNPGLAANGGTITPRSRAPKVIPDERTNSIIVVADEETTLRIRALISQLDSKFDRSGNKFYVYRCQHANAEDLAEVLSGLMGGGSGSSSTGGSTNRTSDSESDMGTRRSGTSSSRSSSRTQSRMSSQQRTPGRSRSEGRSSGSTGTVNIGEDISITADPATNSLVISASRPDYEKIKSLIDKLDIKRRQVLVEAMILEVAINNREKLAASFVTSGGGADGGIFSQSTFGGNIASILSNPTQLAEFTVAAASAGSLKITDDFTIPAQSVLLSALESNSNVNVLSSPNILTTDNEEAEIVVGQNVPFISSTSTSETNLNNTFNQVERQDVGITLRITPQISSSDYVTLQIFTEVSKVIDSPQSSSLGPTTQQRSSETTVIAKDTQMIVIGGLMDDDSNDSAAGVPFLKDVPVLGFLFKGTVSERTKRNLLIFITPRIIKDQFDARDSTLEQRDAVQRTIDKNDLNPRRDDLLNNLDLDKVSEANNYDGPLPSTILPSKKITPKKPIESEDGTIEMSISPKIPAPVNKSAPPAAFKNSNSEDTGARYIVMRINSPEEIRKELPFASKSQNGLIGVVVPAESDNRSRTFFSAGNQYSYSINDEEVSLTPLGIFNSEAEAQLMHADLQSGWYSLSPHELMNLGQGPWIKK